MCVLSDQFVGTRLLSLVALAIGTRTIDFMKTKHKDDSRVQSYEGWRQQNSECSTGGSTKLKTFTIVYIFVTTFNISSSGIEKLNLKFISRKIF